MPCAGGLWAMAARNGHVHPSGTITAVRPAPHHRNPELHRESAGSHSAIEHVDTKSFPIASLLRAMNSIEHNSSWKAGNPNKRRDAISWHAYTSGMKTGAAVSTLVAGSVLTANKYWPAFRNRLNASGKTAIVVMSFLASFTVEAENRLVHGAHNPEMYMAAMNGTYVEQKEEVSKLKAWQRAANFLT
ncbi:hypothetical protein ON010_g18566 [Phytophthora cinnamomi]|nr:hypothetical protein ON010_g18566 [Phytophthora cinnamomi]